MADLGIRFSVYFHKSQIEWLDREAKKLGLSRSKFIEYKVLPKELHTLKDKMGSRKAVKSGE